jgi:hypothetical protein
MLKFFVHGNALKLNCACGLQVKSQKNVKQRTKRKNQNDVFKMQIYSWLYLGLC